MKGVQESNANWQACQEDYSLDRGGLVVTIARSAWHFIHDFHDTLIALFTMLLFIVTALLARYTFGLWVETKTLRERADTDATRQAEDTLAALANITDEELVLVRSGKKFLYFWGYMRYHDPFDGTPIHETTFCAFIDIVYGDPMALTQDSLLEVRFGHHSEYNDMT